MKNNPESDEFCCLQICLFNNGKAIHFRTTLRPLRLLFFLLNTKTITDRHDEKRLSKIMRPKKRSMIECNVQISLVTLEIYRCYISVFMHDQASFIIVCGII